MAKMFITKYPQTVNNSSLLRIGELRYKAKPSVSGKDALVVIRFSKDTKIEFDMNINVYVIPQDWSPISDGTLVSSASTFTASANKYYLLVIPKDTEVTISILDKYALSYINNTRNRGGDYTLLNIINLEDFSFSNDITNIHLRESNTSVTGDLSNISNLVNLTRLDVSNTSVTGDLSNISNLVNLTSLNVNNTSVTGDLSNISNLVNLTSLNVNNTSVTGDLSSISNLVNLKVLELSDTSVTGDLSSLKPLTKLSGILTLNALNISGDLTNIPNNVTEINYYSTKGSITWTRGGRPNGKFMNIYVPQITMNSTSIDNLLIDEAAYTAPTGGGTIHLKGQRTSASDSAIETLQNNNVTVKFNN